MHLLDQDHPDFKRLGRGNRTLAVHAILKATLERSTRFALQFDRARLASALGHDALSVLVPSLAERSAAPDHLYDLFAGELHAEQRRILRRALSPAITDPRTGQLPLAAIRSARGRDERGRTVLRVGDGGGTILFSLPDEALAALVAEYELARIPPTVLRAIDVDVEGLEP